MTAAEAIEIVRRIGGRPYACVHEKTSAYSFTKPGEGMVVDYTLFIQPGFGGDKCESFSGSSIFECCNKAVNALMNEHSASVANQTKVSVDHGSVDALAVDNDEGVAGSGVAQTMKEYCDVMKN